MSEVRKTPSAEPSGLDPPDSGLSRRTFLRGGAVGAIASGGLLRSSRATAAPADEAGDAFVGPGKVRLELEVNGKSVRLEVEPRVTLLDALRDQLDTTGPKKVCDRATCGACTVLEDGELIYACTRLAVEARGRKITTVEALGSPEDMHPVQVAFVEKDAQQCGFCTPGFVLACAVLLEKNPSPTSEQVRRALGGNLCRCGTYGRMRKVVLGSEGERA